jgi:hypothetical protein
VSKYLTAAVSCLSYTATSFLVTQVGFGGNLSSVYQVCIVAGGLIAGLATLAHAHGVERRGLPREAFGSGWTAALVVDIVAAAAFFVLLAIAFSRMQAGL